MRVTIKEYLEQKNISINKLSDMTNISYQALHPLVNNKTQSISFSTLEKICKALNVTPSDILILE